MIDSKNVEKLDNSRVRLSVSINKDEAKKEYDALLGEYSKKAHIKGFRPGKAPASVLEQKFGEGMRVEVAQKLVEESLQKIYEEIDEKPLQYAAPTLESEFTYTPGETFDYVVSYDIFPEVSVTEVSGFTVEEPQVTIGKEALDAELKQIQEQNAIVAQKSSGAAENENIVTIDYVELDDSGAEIDGTARQDYSFTLGSGYNIFKIDEDIVGMEIDQEKIIDKTWPEDEEDKSLAGQTKKIKVVLRGIKVRDLPALDDELAQDVDEKFKTLDDLKKDIKKKLQENVETRLRKIKSDGLLEQMIEKNPIVLPESMISAELQANWQNFIRQFGGDETLVDNLLQAQGNTRDSLFSEWKPQSETRLKSQLILQKLIEDRNIEASEEEVNEEIARVATSSSMSEEEVRNYYQQNNMMDYISQDIKERKLVDQLLSENTVKKGKKIKYLDFIQGNA